MTTGQDNLMEQLDELKDRVGRKVKLFPGMIQPNIAYMIEDIFFALNLVADEIEELKNGAKTHR